MPQDKFILIVKGSTDSRDKGVVRLTPTCYEKIYALKRKTGLSMTYIMEQMVDYALDHMDSGAYDGEGEG